MNTVDKLQKNRRLKLIYSLIVVLILLQLLYTVTNYFNIIYLQLVFLLVLLLHLIKHKKDASTKR